MWKVLNEQNQYVHSNEWHTVRLKRLYLSAESAQSWVNLQRKCCQMLVLFLHPLDKRAVFWCVWLWRTWCWPSSCSAAGEHCWQTGAAVQPVRASKEPFFSPEWESDLQQNSVLPVPCPDLSKLLTVRGGSVLVHVIALSSMKTDMKENWFYLCPELSRLTFLMWTRAL